jgi:hypothetical protein
LEVSVVELNKKRYRASRDLVAIDKTSAAARFYDKMRRDIAADLGGRGTNSRLELELIKAFAGCATRLEYLNRQIMLGDAADCDPQHYSQLASTMLRIAAKLGLSKRETKPDEPDFYRDTLPVLAQQSPPKQHGLLADIERREREREEQRRAQLEADARAASPIDDDGATS